MPTYATRISSVVSRKQAIIIRFSHPADIRIPPISGYGVGECWMEPKKLRYIESALVQAAGAKDLDDLEGRAVTLCCERDGTVEGIAFEDDNKFEVVWFPDFCKP